MTLSSRVLDLYLEDANASQGSSNFPDRSSPSGSPAFFGTYLPTATAKWFLTLARAKALPICNELTHWLAFSPPSPLELEPCEGGGEVGLALVASTLLASTLPGLSPCSGSTDCTLGCLGGVTSPSLTLNLSGCKTGKLA